MTYIGASTRQYTIIEPALGKGGEGSVYQIAGKPDLVLKVFLEEKRTETRHRKILIMISMRMSETAMEQVAWPIDVVYLNNKFIGYVMPKIKNTQEINVMHTSKYNFTLADKIVIAKNLCAAVNAVHNCDQVCGDLNPKNITVNAQLARVTLVDTDSYHIMDKSNSRVYRCDVGLPEYLPREVQEKMKDGKNLATAQLPTFTQYSDLFALAVHIFALLMNGCHPFACAVNNVDNINHLSKSNDSCTCPQPIANICNGFFPFYMKKSGISKPKYAPEFKSLPKEIRKLFVLAFVEGHKDPSKRPTCVQWYNALSKMEKNLKTCQSKSVHVYSSHLRKCPWCELEKSLGISSANQDFVQINQITFNNKSNSKPNKPTQQKTRKKKSVSKENTTKFWVATAFVATIINVLVFKVFYPDLITFLFEPSYNDSFFSLGENIAMIIDVWGFIVASILGVISCKWLVNNHVFKWYYFFSGLIMALIMNFIYTILIAFLPFIIIVLGLFILCMIFA